MNYQNLFFKSLCIIVILASLFGCSKDNEELAKNNSNTTIGNATQKQEKGLKNIPDKLQPYRIVGKISDLTGNNAQIWGVAIPTEGLEGYNPGALFEKGNIIVNNIDNSGHRGANIYEGIHCYLGKTSGKGALGQNVDIFVYGACSGQN